MTLKTLEDLERLEQRVMQIAAQETELLVEFVATPEAIAEAAKDPEILRRQAAYKKNTSNTYMLCERMLRYIAACKVLGKRNLEGLEAMVAEIEKAQRKATVGVQNAKAKLHVIGGTQRA